MADPVLMSLLRINRKRLAHIRKNLAPYKYSGTMHLISLYIKRNPGASQEEIACFHGVDKSTVARDARRLEDMGHIRRETSPDDRRQYKLYLTEEGEKFLPMIKEAHDDFARKLAAGLTEEERNTLGELLSKLEKNALEESTT